jgi:ribose/xylose/arabinose/galactoside ABC-type transport system permease subunit
MNVVSGFFGSKWGQRLTILIAVMIVMAIFQPRFFYLKNAYSILLAIAIYGIIACGMLFVILVGEIDLSVGSTAAMAGCVLTKTYLDSGYTTGGFIAGALFATALCLAVGVFHGIESTYFKMPAFVVTLATQYAIYGAMQMYTEGKYIQPKVGGLYYFLGNGKVLGVPMPVVLFIVCATAGAFVLGRTVFGRKIYAVGGNREASEMVGIKPKRYIIFTYMICSFLAGFGGVVLASLNMTVNQSTAAGYEGQILMTMVVGGINIFGGEGGVPDVIFGALLVGVIDNVLILLGVPAEYQKFIQGVIIIAAIAFNMYQSRRNMGLTGMKRFVHARVSDNGKDEAGAGPA